MEKKIATNNREIANLRNEVMGLNNRWQHTSLQNDLEQPQQQREEQTKRKGPLMAVGICAIHILCFWVFVVWLDPILQPSSPSSFLVCLIFFVPFLLVGNIMAAMGMKENIPEALRLCFLHLCLSVYIESTMDQIRLQQNPTKCDERVLVVLACISSVSILAAFLQAHEYSFSPSSANV